MTSAVVFSKPADLPLSLSCGVTQSEPHTTNCGTNLALKTIPSARLSYAPPRILSESLPDHRLRTLVAVLAVILKVLARMRGTPVPSTIVSRDSYNGGGGKLGILPSRDSLYAADSGLRDPEGTDGYESS